MKCKACGNEIAEDAVFCMFCGKKNAAKQENVQPEQTEQTAQTEPPIQTEQPVQAQTAVQNQDTETPKTRNYVVVILIVLLLIVAIGVVLVFFAGKLFGGAGKENEKGVAYLSNGEIFYVPNMDKEKDPISVCEVRGDYAEDYNILSFTASGKYLYYASRVDDDGFTLCRATVGKLKADSDKNDKYITEIDKDVTDYRMLGTETEIIYSTDNGGIYYFDGETEERIAKNVYEYFVCDDNETLVYLDDEEKLFSYNIKSKKEEKIDTDVQGVYPCDEKDFIVYEKYEDDAYALYYASANGETEQIAENVAEYIGCDAAKKTVYYTAEDSVEQNLYAYIDDPYAGSDAQITEPDRRNYMTQVTEDEALDHYDREDLAKWPEDREWFYDNLSFDSDMEMYYYWNYDVYQYYYYDDLTMQWFSFDEDRYDEEMDAYYAVEDRIWLRETLKEESIEQEIFGLYSCEIGKEPVCINENVISDSFVGDSRDTKVLMYAVSGEVTDKISIDDIYDAYEAQNMVSEMLAETQNGELRYYTGGKEQTLDAEGMISYIIISDDESKLVAGFYDYDENGDMMYSMMAYTLKNGTLSDGTELCDDNNFGIWVNDEFYFTTEHSDGDCDVNVYKNGKVERILKGVSRDYGVGIYDNGVYMALDDVEDVDDIGVSGTLRVYNASGEGTKISNDVSSYSFINPKRVLYVKNDDLYVYTGKKEDRRIARDVEEYTCRETSGRYLW